MPPRFKLRHVNEWVGVFVIGVAVLVVTGIVFSGHSQRWFARKFAFDVLLPQAGTSGLRRGDEVYILGVSAGLVDDVIVQENGRVKARVKIRRDFERFVRADSTAAIKKAFAVAGDSFMEISTGSGGPLEGRIPTIVCVASEDSLGRMEKLVSDLHSELIPVIKQAGSGLQQWTTLGSDLQKSRTELSGLLARLDLLAARLDEGDGLAGRLLTDATMADDAGKLLTRGNDVLSQFQTMATNLDAAARDIQSGAARLPEITGAVANEMKDLPGLVRQTHISMVELERLIEALQRHWLVRKYVEPSHPKSLRPVVETAEPNSAPGKLRRPLSAGKR